MVYNFALLYFRLICDAWNFVKTLFEHDAFEWLSLLLTLAGLVIAWYELRKSRGATELSNRQCLFDRRLRCYFVHKHVFGEITGNWNSLQRIIGVDGKDRAGYIDTAFQLFIGNPNLYNKSLEGDNAIAILNCYNAKVLSMETVPEESRIVFSHLESGGDAGSFMEKYVNMLYRLHIACQLYTGNVREDNYGKDVYDKLCIAIKELEEAKNNEQGVLNSMKNELDLYGDKNEL